MRKLVTISIKVLKIRVFSEKRNIASEENDNETNIKENENEDQDFLICVKSEKVYGPIWEVQVPEEKMETKKAWSLKIILTFCEEEYSRNFLTS